MKIGAECSYGLKVAPERGGLYIHIAYCRSKCIYCDFFSAGDRIADWQRYVDALCSEFNERRKEMACPLRTIYIGGGTPSLMPSEEFSRLCGFLKPYIDKVEEFTIEVNPDDVDEKKLDAWRKAGVNRLSIGIQSFDDKVLSSLGRRHDSATAKKAYELSRRFFSNVSIDLMFGLPGQTIEMWIKDLKVAINMAPEHISAYSLMFEEGTAMTVMRDTGRLSEASEDISENMFLILIDLLKKAGYDHYEISNFALPGYRSKHNSSYWHQKPYLGIGPSAHSYDGERTRKANRADLRGYLDYWCPSVSVKKTNGAFFDSENLSNEELIEEYVMTRMRTREGIPLNDFVKRFGDAARISLCRNCKPLLEKGLIVYDSNSISLQDSAILISDSIILDMLSD